MANENIKYSTLQLSKLADIVSLLNDIKNLFDNKDNINSLLSNIEAVDALIAKADLVKEAEIRLDERLQEFAAKNLELQQKLKDVDAILAEKESVKSQSIDLEIRIREVMKAELEVQAEKEELQISIKKYNDLSEELAKEITETQDIRKVLNEQVDEYKQKLINIANNL